MEMRQLCMRAAIQNSRSPQYLGLTNVTVEEKHATLLLLLLKLKDGFVTPHIQILGMLRDKILDLSDRDIHMTTANACFVCKGAITSWTVESLDNFLIGNLGKSQVSFSWRMIHAIILFTIIVTGTAASAQGKIRAMIDAAAGRINFFLPIFGSMIDVHMESYNRVHWPFDQAFLFAGMSTHDVFLFKCIRMQLTANMFFGALIQTNSLDVVSAAHFLLNHLPFSRLMALFASNNFASITMLLIHAVATPSCSFLNPPSLRFRRASDAKPIVLAAADHLFRIRSLLCPSASHLTALLNQCRKNEVVSAASAPRAFADAEEDATTAPAHISCDRYGDMYVCGTKRTSVTVLDAKGRFKLDISITNCDGSIVPVKFLRATTIDWSSGNVYVTDRDADCVHCITQSGVLLASLCTGVCKHPRGLSFCARSSRVAVADSGNNQVVILDSQLNVVIKLEAPLNDDAKFNNPRDVAFDANGFLYIVDDNHRSSILLPAFPSNVSFSLCPFLTALTLSFFPNSFCNLFSQFQGRCDE